MKETSIEVIVKQKVTSYITHFFFLYKDSTGSAIVTAFRVKLTVFPNVSQDHSQNFYWTNKLECLLLATLSRLVLCNIVAYWVYS
jgi:hypothetical protein